METFICWIVVLLYSAAMIYVGFYLKAKYNLGRNNIKEAGLEFWIARRQLPGWRLATSITSGWLMLGWIGFGMAQVYFYGATGLWILPIPWFILCFIIIIIVPFMRRVSAVSLPQAIEKRFGISARVLLAILSFGVFIAWTQAETYMAGALMAPFLGIPPQLCMVLFIIPIIIYTYLGGFRAIATTDLVQFCVMAVFMVILAVAAIVVASDASGGNLISAIGNSQPPWSGEGQVFNFGFLGWLFPFVLLVGYLPGWLIEQDLAIRLQAAKSTKEATKGAVLALVLITVFVLILPSITAFCALVAFPPVNGAPPDVIHSDATGIISAFISKMPFALIPFMLIGLVACQMSTVDTFANVSALAISYDIVEPALYKKKSKPETRLAVARYISVAVIVFSLVLALINNKLGDVYYISSGVLSASIAIPVMLIFWRRATLPAVLAAAIVGVLGTIGVYYYEYKILQAADANAPNYYANILPAFMKGAYGYYFVASGVVMSFITMVVVSLVTKKPSQAQLSEVKDKPVDDYTEFSRETTPDIRESIK